MRYCIIVYVFHFSLCCFKRYVFWLTTLCSRIHTPTFRRISAFMD